MDSTCCEGVCAKCHGAKYIVLGLVVLANQYWLDWSWALIIGLLFILKGIMKVAMPTCSHCQPTPVKKGKR